MTLMKSLDEMIMALETSGSKPSSITLGRGEEQQLRDEIMAALSRTIFPTVPAVGARQVAQYRGLPISVCEGDGVYVVGFGEELS